MELVAQLRVPEPCGREFFPAVGHVLPAEHAQLQHLARRQLRLETGRKVLPLRLGKIIHVPFLHQVIDHDLFHGSPPIQIIAYDEETVNQ
jgi:hypothetical protein